MYSTCPSVPPSSTPPPAAVCVHMQAFIAPIGAAAAFVYGARYVVANRIAAIAANHPLVVAERKCWAKPDHSLEVDQG